MRRHLVLLSVQTVGLVSGYMSYGAWQKALQRLSGTVILEPTQDGDWHKTEAKRVALAASLQALVFIFARCEMLPDSLVATDRLGRNRTRTRNQPGLLFGSLYVLSSRNMAINRPSWYTGTTSWGR